MKRLYKSKRNKVIDGVCGGIAEYFDVDPVLVRIIFVFFAFFGGSGVIAYLIGMMIMPRTPLVKHQETKPPSTEKQPEETQTQPQPNTSGDDFHQPVPASTSPGSLIIGIIMILMGGIFLLDNLNFPYFHGIFWWFRHHFWDFFIPGIIIILGLILIVKGSEK